jgi:hypothetical protein
MSIAHLIEKAEAILPGEPAPDDELDPRWQTIIAIGEHSETHPEEIWAFVAKWGCHECEDTRSAIATCLLEHVLPAHFELLYPPIERLVVENELFAETFSWCGWFGDDPEQEQRFKELKERVRRNLS